MAIDIDKLEVGMVVGGGPSGLTYTVTSIDRSAGWFRCRCSEDRLESQFTPQCALSILPADPTPKQQLGMPEEKALIDSPMRKGRPSKPSFTPPVDIYASYAAFRNCIDAVFKEHAPKAKYCSDIVRNSEFLLEFNVGNGMVHRRYPANSNWLVTHMSLCEDLQDEALRLGNKQLRG